ncbi:hypothetical protein [Albibacterium indicum]|uniref:hypothetical protein n=1 Tax=Albibacterium indicum TaxID=2292082 RepID=UPI000E4E9E9D|nr:hypothetical protein [Pedobacter indicus]
MSTSASMTPLSLVMNRLNEKGYGNEFKIGRDGAYLEGNSKRYNPDELTIVKTYRFEGDSDPADMAVLYAIESGDGKTGMILNAYGTYSDQDQEFYDKFILDVRVDEREDLEMD